jgi:microcystin-dependent protein
MACADAPYLSSINLWPLSWAPQNWALCQGQSLSVQQYPALYSLFGNTFGGTLNTTFNLPDMRGMVPLGAGQSLISKTNYSMGQKGGVEQNTLTVNQVPLVEHLHPATYQAPIFSAIATGTVTPQAKTGPGTLVNNPSGNVNAPSGTAGIYSPTPNTLMAPAIVNIQVSINKISSGNVTIQPNDPIIPTESVENRMPFLVLNYMICITGIYPIRPD